MSGGYFNYNQYEMEDIARNIEEILEMNRNPVTEESSYYQFSPEILAKFQQAKEFVEIASKMVHRIDWLLSADDGPDSFMKRWNEDLKDRLEKLKETL